MAVALNPEIRSGRRRCTCPSNLTILDAVRSHENVRPLSIAFTGWGKTHATPISLKGRAFRRAVCPSILTTAGLKAPPLQSHSPVAETVSAACFSRALPGGIRLVSSVLRNTAIVLALTFVTLGFFPLGAFAGGPKYVAGTTYFNSGTAGTPLTWSQGLLNYYTDRGNLSPILPGVSADAFVTDALSQWTSIPTAAISAVRGGQLAEDVSGANVA